MKSNYPSFRKGVPSIIVLLTFLLSIVSFANATTYYISPSGNDASGTGTLANPWKTLYKACNTVAAVGDIIHVTSGTFLENTTCELKPGVSIEGEGIAASVIKSGVAGTWTRLLNLFSAQEGSNGNQHIQGLTFDGNGTSGYWGIYVVGRSNVSIHDCKVINFLDGGVLFTGRTDNQNASPVTFSTGNSFYNNTVLNCAQFTGGNGTGCLQVGGQDGMLIHDNTIVQNQRPDGLNGWPLKFLLDGYLKGCKIYNNTLTKNIFISAFGGAGDWDFAVELWHSVGGNEIYNNIIQGGVDLAYNAKTTYAWSYWVHDNIITQPALVSHFQHGIIFERDVEGAIVENNTINNTFDGITFYIEDFTGGTTYNYLSDITVRKNLISNMGLLGSNGNQGAGINFQTNGTHSPFNLTNLNIYNNTIVASAGNAPYEGISMDFSNSPCIINNVNIKNNIIQGFNFNWLTLTNSSSTFNTFNVMNNDAWNNGNSNAIKFNNAIPTGYTNSGNISVMPLFVSAIDFHLQSGSPCVDNGVYVGLPYTGIAPDKGYMELSLILPVKLTNFSVTENKGKNLLQWTTATESNSNYFSVERSSDGQHFEAIGRVTATGFSSSDINYNFTDIAPLQGVNYYRLTMVDKDNSKDYSNIVSVANKKVQSLSIATAELAAGKNNMTLAVVSSQNQKAVLALFDVNGRMFLNEPVQLQKGVTTINKNTAALSAGIYYIRLTTTDETVVKNVFTKE